MFSNSKWIWLEGYDRENTFLSFSDKFNVESKKGTYKFCISVDTNYVLYINEQYVATGQYADYSFDKVYDVLDVTDYVIEGTNKIKVDCWHQGHDNLTGCSATAGLIYSVMNDENLLHSSSEDVLARPIAQYKMGPEVEIVTGQLGHSFAYDSRTEDAEYQAVCVMEKPLPVRIRPNNKLIVGNNEPAVLLVNGTFTEIGGKSTSDKMQYAAMSFSSYNCHRKLPSEKGIELKGREKHEGIFVIIDTGKENAGLLSLDLELEEDAEILVGWGEHLDDLRVRTSVGGRNFSGSYMAHKGRNKFLHYFRRLGMRYLQLNIYSRYAKIYYAGIKTTDYPLDHDVKFTCADELHTKIHEVCKRTLQMSMHEHYEDCPWREQALYSMDSRNQMLCGYYVFKEFAFAKASIRLLGESLRSDNLLELCAPSKGFSPIPSFSAVYLTQAYEYYKYSGDLEFMKEILPVLEKIAGTFVSYLDKRFNLVSVLPGYWNFAEWQEGLDGSAGGRANGKGEDSTKKEPCKLFDGPLTAFVSFGFRSLSSILKALGDAEKSKYYYDLHQNINRGINENLWDEEKHLYASYMNEEREHYHYAELTNSLIIYCDAVSEDRLDHILDCLSRNDKSMFEVTLSHSIFKYDALMRKPEKYARAVFKDIARQWGYMLYNNATTFWETIDGASAFGNAGSLCHGWSAIPVYFYHKYAIDLSGEITGLYECKISE